MARSQLCTKAVRSQPAIELFSLSWILCFLSHANVHLGERVSCLPPIKSLFSFLPLNAHFSRTTVSTFFSSSVLSFIRPSNQSVSHPIHINSPTSINSMDVENFVFFPSIRAHRRIVFELLVTTTTTAGEVQPQMWRTRWIIMYAVHCFKGAQSTITQMCTCIFVSLFDQREQIICPAKPNVSFNICVVRHFLSSLRNR